MGRSTSGVGASFFGIGVNDDSRDPERYALGLRQSGIGLPDRDYYLEERFAPQKARYQQYVAQMLGLAGWEQPEDSAAKVVALETEIARAHWSRAESRNRDKTYNPMTQAELEAQAPGFPWATYFRAAGVDHAQKAIVAQNTAVPKLARSSPTRMPTRCARGRPSTRRAGRAHAVAAVRRCAVRFPQQVPAGPAPAARALEARRRLCRRGDGRGDRARLCRALLHARGQSGRWPSWSRTCAPRCGPGLQNLTWMTPATKQEAPRQARDLHGAIGHPDEWRDYSSLEVRPDDLVGNAPARRQFDWNAIASASARR
jgi:putative endopeptidase